MPPAPLRFPTSSFALSSLASSSAVFSSALPPLPLVAPMPVSSLSPSQSLPAEALLLMPMLPASPPSSSIAAAALRPAVPMSTTFTVNCEKELEDWMKDGARKCNASYYLHEQRFGNDVTQVDAKGVKLTYDQLTLPASHNLTAKSVLCTRYYECQCNVLPSPAAAGQSAANSQDKLLAENAAEQKRQRATPLTGIALRASINVGCPFKIKVRLIPKRGIANAADVDAAGAPNLQTPYVLGHIEIFHTAHSPECLALTNKPHKTSSEMREWITHLLILGVAKGKIKWYMDHPSEVPHNGTFSCFSNVCFRCFFFLQLLLTFPARVRAYAGVMLTRSPVRVSSNQ